MKNCGTPSAAPSHRKRLLYITFDFPPRRTSAIYRSVGVLRKLAPMGWLPTVLTARVGPAEVQDPAMLRKLPPEVDVVRTAYVAVDAWETHAAGIGQQLRQAPSTLPSDSSRSLNWRKLVHRVFRTLANWFRIFVYFPDKSSGWIIPGFIRAVELQMSKRFHLIYTSSPPKSAAVIGLFLKKLFGTAWMCEFRDPWYAPPSRLKLVMQRWLQKVVVRNADVIVTISEGNAEHLRQRFDLAPEKVVVVPNGYDEDDFELLPARTTCQLEPEYVHLSHFGTVYPNFAGEFFSALAELVAENPEWQQRVRVNIVGFPDERTQRERIEFGLEKVVRLIPFVTHLESLRMMCDSNCLLLFLANPTTSRLSGLGKIYWYLRVGRPVLAVAYPGGTQELIERGRAGWVVRSKEEIKYALLRAIFCVDNGGGPSPTRSFAEQFRYERIAEKLSCTAETLLAE